MTETFVSYSPTHWITLAVIAIVTTLLVRYGRRQTPENRIFFARRLGLVILLYFIAEYTWRFSVFGWSTCIQEDMLPLHFCAIMAIISVIALWWRAPWACALVYFGVLSASIQALFTPVLKAPFPEIAFFNFFISHSLLLITAVVQLAVLGWRARRRDPLLSVLLMDAYVLAIHPVNLLLGSNYGFTTHGPAGTILAELGPGPWYYLKLQVPVILLFGFMYLFVRKPSHTPQ